MYESIRTFNFGKKGSHYYNIYWSRELFMPDYRFASSWVITGHVSKNRVLFGDLIPIYFHSQLRHYHLGDDVKPVIMIDGMPYVDGVSMIGQCMLERMYKRFVGIADGWNKVFQPQRRIDVDA